MLTVILVCLVALPCWAQKRKAVPKLAPVEADSSDYPKFTYDLGVSLGSTNVTTNGATQSYSYTEANLGVNTFFNPWLNWRNAAFGRFGSGITNVYGLDTGARLGASLDVGVAGIALFGGGGYRFVTQGTNAPFGEAGAQFSLAGLRLGGGVKVVFNSAIVSGAPNDTQYFLILSGSGQL